MLIRTLLLLLLCLHEFPGCALAQDFTVPSGWQNTASNISRAARLNAAWAAADEVQKNVNASWGIPMDSPNLETGAYLSIAFAYQDFRNSNSFRENQVVDNTLLLTESGNSHIYSNYSTYNIVYDGLAEVAAYLAYNDAARLELAKGGFDTVYVDFVTANAAMSGTNPRQHGNSTCEATIGGLLFNVHGAVSNDPSVLVSAVGLWVTLSARLAELTRNTTYLAAAEQSIQFMQTHVINTNSASDLVSDQFDIYHCVPFSDATPLVWDIGPYIEGLSVVANITQNEAYTQMLNALVPLVVTVPEWHDDTGILKDDTPYSKGTIISGLLEARLRSPSNSGLVALIDSYLTVQYNAVVNNALISKNDYKASWLAGPVGNASYSTAANLADIDVLNAAFVIAPTDNSSAPVTATMNLAGPTDTAIAHHVSTPTPVAAIIGGAVDGTAATVAFALLLFVCARRRRRRVRETAIDEDHVGVSNIFSHLPLRPGHIPEPYTLTGPEYNRYTSTPEKGRSRQPQSDTSITQTPLAVGDADAQQALERSFILERRLENLIHTLAYQGENESNPPEYDGNRPVLPSEHEEVA